MFFFLPSHSLSHVVFVRSLHFLSLSTCFQSSFCIHFFYHEMILVRHSFQISNCLLLLHSVLLYKCLPCQNNCLQVHFLHRIDLKPHIDYIKTALANTNPVSILYVWNITLITGQMREMDEGNATSEYPAN